ncbi:unnamed protein product [Wuchereria bancrofti]|uniref:Uncharacterized protein n=1 Tax=Wuchereria bancrofti TaxID=6293 RepID=A0A3P7EGL8_WUCBA|nr:unnamed protein product [Wuchereria bancrofti]
MSSGATEQENSNPNQTAQLKTPGIVYSAQEMQSTDTTEDGMQKHGVKEFCRAPGHARPTSASASSPSVSPIDEGQDFVIQSGPLRFKFFLKGLKSPIHVGPSSAMVTPSTGTTIPTTTVTDPKSRTELFEAGSKIEFLQNIPTNAPLPSGSDIAEGSLQPLLGTAKSNLDALKTSSIDDKLFSSLDSTRPSIIPSSIANIWDDNIVDDKPWAVPVPLAPVQLEDFARNINVQLPTSAKSASDYPDPSRTADHMVDLAKNIASLRTSVCFDKKKQFEK